MKTLKILVLILLAIPLGSETLLAPAQVRPGPVDSVFVTSSGLTGWVKLGDHEIEMVGGELVFSNIGGLGGSAPSWVQRVELVTAPKADWVLLNATVPGSLDVIRNGSTLSPGVDFNLNGTTVSFLGHVPQPGDVLRFKYQTP